MAFIWVSETLVTMKISKFYFLKNIFKNVLTKKILLFILVLDLISASKGGHVRSRIGKSYSCSNYCKETKNFKYETGQEYFYNYQGSIKTYLTQHENDFSNVVIGSRVSIVAITPCELALKISGTKIVDSSITSDAESIGQDFTDLARRIEKNEFRFSFQDGTVEHICTTGDEEQWILNFKRGIVSLFQNPGSLQPGQSNIVETDVNGKCPTTYNLLETTQQTSIYTKLKNLKECKKRNTGVSLIQSVPYSSDSDEQGLNLLDGFVSCIQKKEHGKIISNECAEEQMFKPFSDSKSGSYVLVNQKVMLIDAKKSRGRWKQREEWIQQSILFQPDEATDPEKSELGFIIDLLKHFEAQNVPDVQSQAPEKFVQLAENLRLLNSESMMDLYENHCSEFGKKLLINSAPFIATLSSIDMMKQLALRNELEAGQLKSWLTSLAFIKNPTLSMISAIKPLISSDQTRAGFLGISSLIHSYCKNDHGCFDREEVRKAIRQFETILGEECISVEEDDKLIIALKALGNIGYSSPEYSTIVEQCAWNSSNNDVRIAAINTYRRMRCDEVPKGKLLSLYQDLYENTEVRIKAYYAAMRCADEDVINRIILTLEKDNTNQVSSFVWSHLTNLIESTDPGKKYLRELLSNKFLKDKFEADPRKFSRNFEGTAFWDQHNLGGTAESNVIFTSDSYIPKSVTSNFTVHLFGASVNIAEFEASFEHLENLLEPIFGPSGLFPERSFTSPTRMKRDNEQFKVNRMDRRYEEVEEKFEKDAKVSFSTKIFGNEIEYKNFEIFHDALMPIVLDEKGENVIRIGRILSDLSNGKEYSYDKSSIMMDMDYTVPTSIGFPLLLRGQVINSISLKLEGKVNFGKLLDKKDVHLDFGVSPSIAVSVDGLMGIRFGDSRSTLVTGLKLQNTLSSSTAFKVNLEMNKLEKIKVNINLPKQKQELFKSSSQFLILTPSLRRPVESFQNSKKVKLEKYCLGDGVSWFTGVQLCAHLPTSVESDFSQPFVAEVFVEKTSDFNGYLIEFGLKKNSDELDVTSKFGLVTSASINDKLYGFDFTMNYKNKTLRSKLMSPYNEVIIEGESKFGSKKAYLKLKSGDTTVLLIDGSLQREMNKTIPVLNVEFYDKPLFQLEGTMISTYTEEGSSHALNFTVTHLTEKPIEIEGTLFNSPSLLTFGATLNSEILRAEFRSMLVMNNSIWRTTTHASYSYNNAPPETLKIDGEAKNFMQGALRIRSLKLVASMSQLPHHALKFDWRLHGAENYLQNTVTVNFGKTNYDLGVIFNKHAGSRRDGLEFNIWLLAPHRNIDFKFELAHRYVRLNVLASKFLVQTNNRNKIFVSLNYSKDIDSERTLKNIEVEVGWPGSKHRANLKIKDLGKERRTLDLDCSLNGHEIKATVYVDDRSDDFAMRHQAEFWVKGLTSKPFSGHASFAGGDGKAMLSFLLSFADSGGVYGLDLEYNIVRRKHRLAGKLVMNTMKYTLDGTLGRTKHGEMQLSAYLHFNKRMKIEAALRDLTPNLGFSFSLTPDLENPSNQLIFHFDYDGNSVSADLDFFNEPFSFRVERSHPFMYTKISWPTEQTFEVNVTLETFTWDNVNMQLDIKSPWEGYSAIKSWISFSLKETNLDLSFGALGKDLSVQAMLELGAINDEMMLRTYLRNHEKYLFNVEMGTIYTSLHKKAIIRLDRDDESFLLEAQLRDNYLDYITAFSLHGLPNFPEIHVNLSTSKNYFDRKSSFILSCRANGVSEKSINLMIEHDPELSSLHFTLTTPWKLLSLAQGKISQSKEDGSKEFSLQYETERATRDLITKVSIMTKGSLQSFAYKGAFNNMKDEEQISFHGNGRYISVLNSFLHADLRVYDTNMNFSLSTKFDPKEKVGGNFKAEFNKEIVDLGFDANWDLDKANLSAQLWSKLSGKWNYKIILQQKAPPSQDSPIQMEVLVYSNNELLMSMQNEITWADPNNWKNIFKIDSMAAYYIPSFQSSIKVNSWEDFYHEFIYSPPKSTDSSTPAWLPKKGLRWSFTEKNSYISGAIKYGNDELTVKGTLDLNFESFDLNLHIYSLEARVLSIEGSFKNYDKSLSSAMLKVYSKSEEFIDFKFEKKQIDTFFSTVLYAETKWLPKVEVSTSSDSDLGAYQFLSFINEENFVQMNATVEMSNIENSGSFSLNISSAWFQFIDHCELKGDYVLHESNIRLSGFYKSSSNYYKAKAYVAWETQDIKIELNVSGGLEFEGILNVVNFGYLKGYYRYKDSTVNSAILTIKQQISQDGVGYECQFLRKINGIDKTNLKLLVKKMDKAVQFELYTPYDGMRRTTVTVHYALSPAKKMIVMKINRDNDAIVLDAKLRKSRKGSMMQGKLDIKGFQDLTSYVSKILKLDERVLENAKLSIRCALSAEKMMAAIESSIFSYKNIVLGANWSFQSLRTLTVKVSLDDETYEVFFQLVDLKPTGFEADVELKVPSMEKYKLHVDYMSYKGIQAKALLTTPETLNDISVIAKNGILNVTTHLNIPYLDIKKFEGALNLDYKEDNRFNGSVSWTYSDLSHWATWNTLIESNMLHLNAKTSLPGWQSFDLRVESDSYERYRYKISMDKNFEEQFNVVLKTSGLDEALVKPFFLDMEAKSNYINLAISINENFSTKIQGDMYIPSYDLKGRWNISFYNHTTKELSGHVDITSRIINLAVTASFGMKNSNIASMVIEAVVNGTPYEVTGNMNFEDSFKKIELNSSFFLLQSALIKFSNTEDGATSYYAEIQSGSVNILAKFKLKPDMKSMLKSFLIDSDFQVTVKTNIKDYNEVEFTYSSEYWNEKLKIKWEVRNDKAKWRGTISDESDIDTLKYRLFLHTPIPDYTVLEFLVEVREPEAGSLLIETAYRRNEHQECFGRLSYNEEGGSLESVSSLYFASWVASAQWSNHNKKLLASIDLVHGLNSTVNITGLEDVKISVVSDLFDLWYGLIQWQISGDTWTDRSVLFKTEGWGYENSFILNWHFDEWYNLKANFWIKYYFRDQLLIGFSYDHYIEPESSYLIPPLNATFEYALLDDVKRHFTVSLEDFSGYDDIRELVVDGWVSYFFQPNIKVDFKVSSPVTFSMHGKSTLDGKKFFTWDSEVALGLYASKIEFRGINLPFLKHPEIQLSYDTTNSPEMTLNCKFDLLGIHFASGATLTSGNKHNSLSVSYLSNFSYLRGNWHILTTYLNSEIGRNEISIDVENSGKLTAEVRGILSFDSQAWVANLNVSRYSNSSKCDETATPMHSYYSKEKNLKKLFSFDFNWNENFKVSLELGENASLLSVICNYDDENFSFIMNFGIKSIEKVLVRLQFPREFKKYQLELQLSVFGLDFKADGLLDASAEEFLIFDVTKDLSTLLSVRGELTENGEAKLNILIKPKEIEIRGIITPTNDMRPWWEGQKIDLTVFIYSEESYHFTAEHQLEAGFFTMNGTIKGVASVECSVDVASDPTTFYAKFDWNESNTAILTGKIEADHFQINFANPWNNVTMDVYYKNNPLDIHASVKDGLENIGFFTLQTGNDILEFHAEIKIPSLNIRKGANAKISISKENDQYDWHFEVFENNDDNVVVSSSLLRGNYLKKLTSWSVVRTFSAVLVTSPLKPITLNAMLLNERTSYRKLQVSAFLYYKDSENGLRFEYELPSDVRNQYDLKVSVNVPYVRPLTLKLACESESFSDGTVEFSAFGSSTSAKWRAHSWNYWFEIKMDIPPFSNARRGYNLLSIVKLEKTKFYAQISGFYQMEDFNFISTFDWMGKNGMVESKTLLEVPFLLDGKYGYEMKGTYLYPNQWNLVGKTHYKHLFLNAKASVRMKTHGASGSIKFNGLKGDHLIKFESQWSDGIIRIQTIAESQHFFQDSPLVSVAKVDVKDGINLRLDLNQGNFSDSVKFVYDCYEYDSNTCKIDFKFPYEGIQSKIEWVVHNSEKSRMLNIHGWGFGKHIYFSLEPENYSAHFKWNGKIFYLFEKIEAKCKFNFHWDTVDVLVYGLIDQTEVKTEFNAWFISPTDFNVKLDIITPIQNYERFLFQLKCSQNEGIVQLRLPFENHFFLLRISGIQKSYRNWKTEGLHPLFEFRTPLGSIMSSLELIIPFTVSKEYGAVKGTLEHTFSSNDLKKYYFGAEMWYKADPSNNIHYGPLKLKLNVQSPHKILQRFALEYFCDIFLLEQLDSAASVHYNDEKLHMETSIFKLNDNFVFKSKLVSPFENYEQVEVLFSWDNSNSVEIGKSIYVQVKGPENIILLSVHGKYHFRYKSFADTDGEILYVVRSSSYQIPALAIKFGSAVDNFDDGHRQLTSYISGQFGNEYKPMIKLDIFASNHTYGATISANSAEERNDLQAEVVVSRKSEVYSLKSILIFQNLEVFSLNCGLDEHTTNARGRLFSLTPWGVIYGSFTGEIPKHFIDEEVEQASFLDSLRHTYLKSEFQFDGEKIAEFNFKCDREELLSTFISIWNPLAADIHIKFPDGHRTRKIMKIVVWKNVLQDPFLKFLIDLTPSETGGWEGQLSFKASDYFRSNASFTSEQLQSSRGLDTLYNTEISIEAPLREFSLYFEKHELKGNNKTYVLQTSSKNQSYALTGAASFSDGTAKYWHELAIKADDDPKIKKVTFNLDEMEVKNALNRFIYRKLKFYHFGYEHPITVHNEQTLCLSNGTIIEYKLLIFENEDLINPFEATVKRNSDESIHGSIIHVPSGTNITGVYELIDTPYSDGHIINIFYKNMYGETEVYRGLKKKDNFHQIMTYSLQNQMEEFFFMKFNDNHPRYEMKMKLFDFITSCHCDLMLPFLQVTASSSIDDELKLQAGLQHKNQIVFNINRKIEQRDINDVHVSVRLNQSEAISVEFNWRPLFFKDILGFNFSSDFISVDPITRYKVLEFVEILKSECNSKSELYKATLLKGVDKVWDATIKELLVAVEAVRNLLLTFRDAYERNSFYIKDIQEYLFSSGAAVSKLLEHFPALVEKFLKQLIDWTDWIIKTAYYNLNNSHWNVEKLIMDFWNGMEQILQNWCDYQLKNFSKTIDFISSTVERFTYGLETRLSNLQAKFSPFGFIKKALTIYANYAKWIEDLSLSEFFNKIGEVLNIRLFDQIKSAVEPLIEEVKKTMNSKSINKVLATPPFPYIRYLIHRGGDVIYKIGEIIEIEEQAKNIVQLLFREVESMLKAHLPSHTLIWTPEKGVVEYHQFFNFIEWDDFLSSPRWRQVSENEVDGAMLKKMYFQIFEGIHSIKSMLKLTVRDIFPPFGGHAMMTEKHYLTFDRRYFHQANNFFRQCSFLLAGDLLHKEFSLFANYKNGKRSSYTIVKKDKTKIGIDIAKLSVSINGVKIELPVELNTTRIFREATQLIIVDEKGFKLECNLFPKVCSFYVSGWYFGRLGGLLGTFDNEGFNDWINPEGQLVNSIDEFMSSWRVEHNANTCLIKSSPALSNRRDDYRISKNNKDNDDCYRLLYGSHSPLRVCYGKVDRTPFYRMCLDDMMERVPSGQNSICAALSSYVIECQRNHIDVWLPPECVTCVLNNQKFLTTGENVTLATDGPLKPEKGVDVVLLIEEAKCFKGVGLKNLIETMAATLRSGYNGSTNRYISVGFGGQGIYYLPHIRSLYGDVFVEETLLRFPPPHAFNGPGNGDLYAALKYAAKLPYRPGVTKLLVAFTCNIERCGGTQEEYSEVATLLVENDLRLHLASLNKFELKKPKPIAPEVLGIDSQGPYTMKSLVKDRVEPDMAFSGHVKNMKDLCSPIATQTNGTVFSISKIDDKMIDIWTKRILQSVEPLPCQRCKCSLDLNGSSKWTCVPCTSPSMQKVYEFWKQSTENDQYMEYYDFDY